MTVNAHSSDALQIQTIPAGDLEPADVEQLLKNDQRSMIYSTPAFLAFLEDAAGCQAMVITARRSGRLVGLLPFASKTKPGWGTVLNSLPWYGSYGGCHVAEQGDDDCRQRLLESFKQHASLPDVLSAQMTVRPAEMPARDLYAKVLVGSIEHPLRLQWSTLPLPSAKIDEELLATYRQKTRNLVRKSLKQGFDLFVTDEDWAWEFLAETHSENMRIIGGQAKPASQFEALRRHLPLAARKLLVARYDGVPAAALLLLFHQSTVEYLTPVVQQKFRPLQPLSFLIHEGMKLSAAAGYCYWNWGGTWASQTTLHHFKEGFGAATLTYCYLVLSQPQARGTMRKSMLEARAAFPYFYLYPFHLLEECA